MTNSNNGDPAPQVNRDGLPPGKSGTWDLDDLGRRFARFSTTEIKGSSPLYAALAARIAEDRDLLRLCRDVRPGQLPANMLFGAVHYLLQGGADHPLRAFYPSLATLPRPPVEAFPAFRDFCLVPLSRLVSRAPRLTSRESGTDSIGLYPPSLVPSVAGTSDGGY